MEPQTERLVQYLAHMTSLGILDCRNPLLAAHQFMGMLNEPSLWPWMIGREGLPLAAEDVVETLRTFLQRYRLPQSKGNSKDDAR
ncbi:TetR/AcrR family transcriptional regulator C-terminal domain-containing protein [Rhizobium ruizarguesonis]|jgi:TetR/AcrR family transcriptional regulator of autoinduction and epiphytic fitness|uniref:TetR/AcrR family transcriptional regulator C-terminal domain-containing protein n=1 Tax=Rhizobium ruizarguesonis TaxID=2081791 RepID=UPI001E5AE33A|nr:TetR/AcrR family transcriptional regulator C-terminal domain-containing protein [Rhizobium ruizarguesonis]UFW94442.1 TetR/AcrR family transcriptional regulator C-terminal domain-containing protein [Rhizobium ruizarguesonis]